ncbi:hypothetical protein [Caulobacter sp.]|uniref:hypothetical protein n=1 Tax=Caulobacter sp. TaxID=78 RepID=UPI003BB15AC2
MATEYDIRLTSAIHHGSDIQNKGCVIVFTYPDGSSSGRGYSGRIVASLNPSTVRIASPILNIDSGWAGANGGTLTIHTAAPLAFGIVDCTRRH